MPDGTRQFVATLNGKATLWEGKICPEDPELDLMMRLLRAEAFAVSQEKATQALTMAVLGATVTVSGDEYLAK